MKVIAYTALHYGRDYLAYAIRSIINHIDEYHVLYSAIGSHGTRTDVPCPETRAELFAIAQRAAGDKLRWHDGEWPHEGAQRDSIYQYAPDADVIIVLDADEIWPIEIIQKVESESHQFLHNTYADISSGSYEVKPYEAARYWRVPMIHYWRSFYRCVTDDPVYPVRVIFPNAPESEATLPTRLRINHMGYAQRSEIVEYKQLTHGHRGEWRPEWYTERFAVNAQADCHPVVVDYWNPQGVNPLDYMPVWMNEHPYFAMRLIP